ncbi:MAG TPA: hypothetical protein VI462_14645, partial [Acidimicrobiia bacterium]
VSRQGSQESDVLSTQPPPPAATPSAAPPPPAAVPAGTDPSATRAGAPLPPPPPAAAPAPTGTGASGGGRTVGPGDVIIALGLVGLVVSIFLHWLDFSHSISGTQVTERYTASGVPIQVLVNYTTARRDPSFLVLLIPLVVLGLVALLVVRVRWLAIVGGIVAVLVAAMYSYQLEEVVHTSSALHGFGLWDFLGIGPIICAVAGVLLIVGGALPAGQR